MIKNRLEAGKLLAKNLSSIKQENGIVLGLPRGGVVPAKEIASELNWPLDVFISRKLTPLENPEFAIAAITETGHLEVNEQIISSLATLDAQYLEEQKIREEKEIERRKLLFRKGRELAVKDKTVIIADDGIATGLTLLAAINSVKKLGAKKVIVAVGVAPKDTVEDFKTITDRFEALESPQTFFAVGQFFEDFNEVTDEEVINILYNL